MGIKQLKKYEVQCDLALDRMCLTSYTPNSFSSMLADSKRALAEKLSGDGWNVFREMSYAKYDDGKMDWVFECPACVEKTMKEIKNFAFALQKAQDHDQRKSIRQVIEEVREKMSKGQFDGKPV